MSAFEQAVLTIQNEKDDQRAVSTIRESLDQDPNLARQIGYEGLTLLHHASRRPRPNTIRLLLKHGANPNLTYSSGATPLRLCGSPETSKERKQCRDLLLAAGAKLTSLEETVALMDAGKDDEVIANLETNPGFIKAWYPPDGSLLHMAAWLCRGAGPAHYLLEHGADPNAQDHAG